MFQVGRPHLRALTKEVVFPITDMLNQAGTDYEKRIERTRPEDSMRKIPPFADKWCALCVAIQEATLKWWRTDSEASHQEKDKIKEHTDLLHNHIDTITSLDKLVTIQMRCSHRLTSDKKGTVLTVMSITYAAELAAIQAIFKVIFNVVPTPGPAPPTKSERKAGYVLKNADL